MGHTTMSTQPSAAAVPCLWIGVQALCPRVICVLPLGSTHLQVFASAGNAQAIKATVDTGFALLPQPPRKQHSGSFTQQVATELAGLSIEISASKTASQHM